MYTLTILCWKLRPRSWHIDICNLFLATSCMEHTMQRAKNITYVITVVSENIIIISVEIKLTWETKTKSQSCSWQSINFMTVCFQFSWRKSTDYISRFVMLVNRKKYKKWFKITSNRFHLNNIRKSKSTRTFNSRFRM